MKLILSNLLSKNKLLKKTRDTATLKRGTEEKAYQNDNKGTHFKKSDIFRC